MCPNQTTRRFDDQVVIVTGAGGGIGAAISARFAVEGARVLVCDADDAAAKTIADELTGRGLLAEARVFDVTDPEACTVLAADVVDSHGRIDVLANNAGINRRGDLLSLSADDWSATFAVNVDALFHLCRAVLPAMIESGKGAVVNTASQWGLHPAPGHVAYNVSKAAVVSFTRNLARDYAPRGIRVNAVCPGEIHTPMLEAGLTRKGLTVADLDRKVPFGRIGRPEEVAALVAFLASDEAPFICGAAVEITGAQAVS
ncbi:MULTISPECIES: SDR family NAD(P)-dependent oxidoreductase [unclassified Rhodococcus (in: high G+C Gram-positive bacteria)]|uniref:SDR family NAD(P)-dependent oxidoreductase n=1 Tax=unclassified Rhodococcus (in: high G+C Gram-positive bacteria) TaxID=192944 RepID=UPI00163A73EE|nr:MULTISPECIES: SDR family NAD(P)-dependent oxidoreductase [unclassified Rhodococcus (in: high G+C Gram-positive bacteria)]MBC2640841.1 SDR family oxidoreductase [Rhodococcus sp. 3A]MBC2894415.1 SDR family oxidoreductase [Rhodococcus sp. 4CII]